MKNRDGKNPTTATRGKLERALIELESFVGSYRINGVTDREFASIKSAISRIQVVESRMYQSEQSGYAPSHSRGAYVEPMETDGIEVTG